MKKLIALLLALTLLFAFAACGKTAETDTTISLPEEETDTPAVLDTATYNEALAALYDEEKANTDESLFKLNVVLADLNSDGYRDVICTPSWFPKVMIYDNGKFVDAGINALDCTFGSNFPVADGAGFFICKDDGTIIVRDSGHNEGSKDTHRAVAYKITGTAAELLWEIKSDDAAEDISADFDAKYNEKTAGHELLSFYDEAKEWVPAA